MSRTVTREVLYYNIDMIISIGYRVNFIKGTQFRIWANKIQKDVSEKYFTFSKINLDAKDLISKINLSK